MSSPIGSVSALLGTGDGELLRCDSAASAAASPTNLAWIARCLTVSVATRAAGATLLPLVRSTSINDAVVGAAAVLTAAVTGMAAMAAAAAAASASRVNSNFRAGAISTT